MKLTLKPKQGRPGRPEMTLHVAGDVLTIDGAPYDLSAIPEGGEGIITSANERQSCPVLGPVKRLGGVLHVCVLVRLGDTAADDQGRDPWVIADAAGDVVIPAIRKPEPEPEPEPEVYGGARWRFN